MDITPRDVIQFLCICFFVYIAIRLVTRGIAKSWFEIKQEQKEKGNEDG